MPAIHVGDVGTELVVAVVDETGAVVDISSCVAAGTKLIYLTPPGGPTAVLQAVFDTNGVNGLMKYVTIADVSNPTTVPGTLSKSGTWKIEGWVDLGTPEWSCDELSFEVLPSRRFVDANGDPL